MATRSKQRGVVVYLSRREAQVLALLAGSGLDCDPIVGPEVHSVATKLTKLLPTIGQEQMDLWKLAGRPHYSSVPEEP